MIGGLIASACLAAGSPAYGAPTVQSVFETAAPAVLLLELLDEAGKTTERHTAIVTGIGIAVTRCRVIDGSPRLAVRIGGELRPVSVGARDDERDLCQLLADLPGVGKPLYVATREPAVGSLIIAVTQGYYGSGPMLSTGVVSGLHQRGSAEAIQFSAPIAPGGSGGALLDDEGRLVGVIDYQLRDGQNVNFAAPARWIETIEARVEAQQDFAQAKQEATRLWREKNLDGLEQHGLDWTRRMPDCSEAWHWLGIAQGTRERLVDAEQSLLRALKIDPENIQIRIGVARMMMLQNKAPQARDLVRAGLALRQESASLWQQLAEAEYALGNLETAKLAFETVVRIDPWAEQATRRLMGLAQSRGDVSGEMDAARRMAGMRPDSSDVWLDLALSYIHGNRLQRAQAAIDQAAALVGENGDVTFVRASLAYAQGRFSDAIRLGHASLRNSHRFPANSWTLLGHSYYRTHLFPQAVAAYRQAVALDAKQLVARDWLIVTLKDNEQLEEAIALLEPLSKSEPKNPFVWRQIGMVRRKQNDLSGAAEAFRESLKLDPKQPKFWSALVETEVAAGRYTGAMTAYETLRGMDRGWAEDAWKNGIRIMEAMQ